jgi:hypothetical protein
MTISEHGGSATDRCVIVVGGGTAGHFRRAGAQASLPELDVTLVESSKIPIIGVGEATAPLMPPFLRQELAIDIVELYREVRPTWKLGIKFEWGLPGEYSFNFAFGDGSLVEAFAQDGHIANQSLIGLMMSADRTQIVADRQGTVLLGQQVPCPRPATPSLSKVASYARGAETRRLVGRAFTQADALDLVRRRPDLLQEFLASESSWLNCVASGSPGSIRCGASSIRDRTADGGIEGRTTICSRRSHRRARWPAWRFAGERSDGKHGNSTGWCGRRLSGNEARMPRRGSGRIT